MVKESPEEIPYPPSRPGRAGPWSWLGLSPWSTPPPWRRGRAQGLRRGAVAVAVAVAEPKAFR